MLGAILTSLTDATEAPAVAAAIASPALLTRIAAAAGDRPIGPLIADRVRHLVEHGDEALWLDLLSLMAGSPQPGAAAVQRMLAAAFPDPVRVRVTQPTAPAP